MPTALEEAGAKPRCQGLRPRLLVRAVSCHRARDCVVDMHEHPQHGQPFHLQDVGREEGGGDGTATGRGLLLKGGSEAEAVLSAYSHREEATRWVPSSWPHSSVQLEWKRTIHAGRDTHATGSSRPIAGWLSWIGAMPSMKHMSAQIRHDCESPRAW